MLKGNHVNFLQELLVTEDFLKVSLKEKQPRCKSVKELTDYQQKKCRKARDDMDCNFDKFSMKPAKIVRTPFDKTYYQSYWLKCIERILDYRSPFEPDGIGYYCLFYMPDAKVWYQNSYKHGHEHCRYEKDLDHKERESYFNVMKILAKRVEYDLENDDLKLHLHAQIYARHKNPLIDEDYSDYDNF